MSTAIVSTAIVSIVRRRACDGYCTRYAMEEARLLVTYLGSRLLKATLATAEGLEDGKGLRTRRAHLGLPLGDLHIVRLLALDLVQPRLVRVGRGPS